MIRSAVLAAAVVLACVLFPLPAASSLIASKQVDCAPGEFVVGLVGKTGAWIDAVGPMCARWDVRQRQAVEVHSKRPAGGSGGGRNEQGCPAGSAIGAWNSESIIAGDAAFTDRITLECLQLLPPHSVVATRVYGGQNNLPRGRGGPRKGRCQKNQLATGVVVWLSLDGRFVTDAKMQCGPAPY